MATLKTNIIADASQFLNTIKQVLAVAEQLGAELKEATVVGDIDIGTSGLEEAVSEIEGIEGASIETEVDVDDSQVQELPDKFEEAGKQSGQSFNKGLKGINFGALASVGAVAGLGALAVKAGETADRLLDLNNITDISTDTLQEFQFISNQAGVETEALSRGAESLTKRLGAVRTGNEPVVESLKKLGVSFKDANGEIRSTEDVMNESIEALAGLENQTERNQLSSQLFGGAYKDLAPVLGLGADAIKNLREEANELGLVKTNQELVDANAFRAQLDELKAIAGSIAFDIGSALQPLLGVLIPIVKDLVELVVNTIKPVIEALTPVLDEIFTAVGDLAGVLGELLADVLGNIAELLAPLGKLLVPIIEAVTEIMKELSPVITEIIDVVVELVDTLLVALEPILTVILDVFVDLIKVAIKPLLPLLRALAPLIQALAPLLQLVATLVTPLIELLGVGLTKALGLITDAIIPVIEFIGDLTEEVRGLIEGVSGFITDIADTLGLIDKKETEVKIESNAEEVKDEVEELNNVEAPEIEAPIKPVAPPKEETKKTVADLSKFVTDLFESNPINIKTDFELSDIGIDEALDFFNNGTALTGDKDLLAEINVELEKIAELKSTIAETDQFIELQIEGKDQIISDLSGIRDETDDVLDKLENKRVDLFSQLNTDITPEKRSEILREIDALNDKILKRTIETAKDSNLTKEQLEDATNERLRQLKIASTEALNKEILEKEKALNDLKAEFTSTSERDLQKLRLELADETNENLKQKEILQAEERFADLLNKFRDNEQAQLLIKQAYDKELRAIDEKYKVTVTSLYEDIAKTFAESLSSYDPQNIIDKNKEIEDSINSVKSEYESETEALNEQLKNREISYSEYNAKIVELEEEKNSKLSELTDQQVGFFGVLQDAAANSFNAITESLTTALEEQNALWNETNENFIENADTLTSALEQTLVIAGSQFAELAVSGELGFKQLAGVVIDSVSLIVDALAAQIIAQGAAAAPFGLGVPSALGLVALVKGLLAAAKAGIGGANDGVIGLNEGNKGKPKGNDSILMMLAPNESVITASGTAKNKPYLEFINKGGSIADLINPNVYTSDMSETNKRIDETNRRLQGLEQSFRRTKVEHFYDKQPTVNLNNTVNIKSRIPVGSL